MTPVARQRLVPRAIRASAVLAFAVRVLLAVPALSAAGPYFVDNSRPDESPADGGRLTPFKQIQDAADVVQPGETVYVKQTEIPYDAFEMKRSGLPAQPIQFIGYAGTSLDSLDDGQGVPQEYSDLDADNYRGEPRESIARSPQIHGAQRSARPGNPVAVDFQRQNHIHLANFWISDANMGIVLNGSDHCAIRNVYIRNLGDQDDSYDGRGILLRGDADDNRLVDCTLYNAGQQAITLVAKSDRNWIERCRVFSDDDSHFEPLPGGTASTSVSATHYYFVVEDGNENTFVDCSARRYKDPVSGLVLRHGGHGFVFQAKASLGQEAVGNRVVRCDTLDMCDVILLRWPGAHDNVLEQVLSNIENEGDDNPELGWRSRPVGRICFLGGAHHNVFRECRLVNADTAIAIFGHTGDAKPSEPAPAASWNRFEDCVFHCERAIVLSEFLDERTAGAKGQNNNLIVDGTQQPVIGNAFVRCEFVGDPDPQNRPPRGEHNQNRFFQSAREAWCNWLENCTISNFDRFSEGSTGQNAAVTPLPIVGRGSFRFSRCRFNIENFEFWFEPHPTDPRSFGLDDLGQGNRLESTHRLNEGV